MAGWEPFVKRWMNTSSRIFQFFLMPRNIVLASTDLSGRRLNPRPSLATGAAIRWIRPTREKGWLDEQRVVLEILTGVQRAGAEIILTYHAKDVARWLKA